MAEKVVKVQLKVEFSLKDLKTKGAREAILTEIKKNVCALFNSGGGELVLIAKDATENNVINADSVVRPIEQQFLNIIGTEVHYKFNILERTNSEITLDIQGLPKICTLTTNLFLPTCTEIPLVQATEHDRLQEILFEPRIVEISEQTEVFEEFLVDHKCGFFECQTVQFKYFEKEGYFADRVINNKFVNIISGFANASGGRIFYGIKDDGTVAGQHLSDPEKEAVTKKLEAKVRNMIWPEEVKRGKHWNISFVPCNIKSMYVVVISVFFCVGGVFTKEPESYYVENGEVKKMSFDSWKRNVLYKRNTNIPKTVQREIWSSKSRNEYMKVTERLEYLRQLGKWKEIEDRCGNEQNDLPVNVKLVYFFQLVAVNYRQGNFENAEKYLMKFRKTKNSTEDKSVFDLEERYSASAIERSRRDYRKAWSIIEEGLALAENAPTGFVAASFYANAASVLSSLINDESFISESKDKKDLEEQTEIKKAEDLCYRAFDHLKYIENGFEIAREELKQRIAITSALLCLRRIGTDHDSISDIKAVTDKISECEQSLQKLKGTSKTPRLTYNQCRLLMIKSDLSLKMYQLTPTDIEHAEESLEYIQQAQKLATKNNFHEITMSCAPREEHLNELIRNSNENQLDEKVEDKCR